MAFIPTAGCVRTDIMFTCAGQQMHNIIWVARETTWTEEEREALNAAIAAWWNTSAKSNFTSAVSLVQITSVNQEASNSPSSTLVVTPAVPGTINTGAVPNNAAHCATLRTDLRGRSFRGRFYAGGFPASSLTDSISWSTQQVTNLLTLLGALKTAIEALGAVWVVVSKYTNKVPRAQGLKTPISAISADQYVDSQRRRLGLRGV